MNTLLIVVVALSAVGLASGCGLFIISARLTELRDRIESLEARLKRTSV